MRIEELAAVRNARHAPFQSTATPLQPSLEFIEKLPLAIYACDADGCILWFNARAAQLWAREPRIGDDSEKYCGSYRRYFDGLPIARDETPMASVLKTGLPVREALGLVERPDGSTVWAMMHIEPIKDHNGIVRGAINCFHDVTDRVRAEELVRQKDQRLAATYELAEIGIAEVNADGELARVNAHLAALLGYPEEELLGRSIFDPALTDTADADQVQFRRQVNGEINRYTIEKHFLRRDGGGLWASVTSSSVCDGDGRFLYAVRVQEDVTARKVAEVSLARRAEEQTALYEFTEALQHSGDSDDVCTQAMAAIFRALCCDRVSILLLDSFGVMKFAQWRGLSDTYRGAVEGHSPWPPDATNPVPICINDIQQSELPDALKSIIREEGIAALAFIPITSNGRLLGKFMTYYDRPHVFANPEKDLALTIASQLGFALERMRAERAAQQLVAIVESSDDAIISKDISGIINTWNQGAERLFGYTADEVIGRPVTILIPADRLSEEPAILARIRRGERVDHFETVRRRKDGSDIDISLTISPVRDEHRRIIGASKIARDITDRKEAEAKLQDSERRLKELLAAIPAAIYTTDATGKITYFNNKAAELAGRIPKLGSDEWCITWKLYWPDGTPMPHDQCPMAVALKEGRAIRNAEAIAERPDGTRVPFIPYPTPLRDANGNIVGAINMLIDVSERKQAETQQRILFDELNHRVKNNMQTLQSLLSLAVRKTSSPEAKRILEEATCRIASMTAAQQVLYGTSDASRFNAQEFLEAICDRLRQTFSREVKVICEAADVELSNDSAMPLALIVNELLTNAVKHGLNGSGPATVRVGLTRQNHSVLFYVEDEGPGFDLTAVRKQSSGLQLVEGLARQLRGKVEVTTNPRCRCTVHFEEAL
jgi:PAS domain S-box-containing protein